MIFPSEDRVLFTQELGTYGITYVDVHDSLIIAPELKGYPDRVPAVVGYVQPFDIVGPLLLGEEFIGALFPSAAQLIFYFWNGAIPAHVPVDYLADMADLYFNDQMYLNALSEAETVNVRATHACVRELLRGTASLPTVIIERIRDSISTYRDTVH